MSKISENFKKTDTVFHYCKTSVAIENILFEKRLRLSSRKNSIDPIENTKLIMSYAVAGISDKDVKRIEEETQEDFKKIKQKLDTLIDNARQVCFCMNSKKFKTREIDEDYGFIKARMWDQYGDSYKGICIAFSKEKILKLNEKIILKGNVNYLKYEELKTKNTEIDLNDIKEVGYNKYSKKLLDYVGKILFLKNIDYKNENEFRICTLSSEEYDYINIKDCIVGIIAPMKRINPYSRKMLKEYCKPIDIDLIDISWDANSVSYRKYYNNTLYPGEY